MNKRFCTRANRLFRYSQKGDTARRESDACCAFYCALPERARTFILTLLMVTLTLVASPFVMGDSEAHAYLSEDKTTATVADFDELKKAVEGSDGYANVRNIVIDPQAAIDFTDINDENAQVSYGDGAFYIPIEQPIRVSRDVTITNAEGVQVVFARSKKGGNGDYDSKAFAGANADWPALFNVISSRGTLTIEGDIVMTGEVVSADFNEEEASFTFDAEANEWSRGNGTGIVDGGYFIHSVNGGEVVVNEGVTLTELVTDNTVTNAAPIYLGGGSTYTMNGGAITGNSFAGSVKDVKDATTAGGIIVMDDKTSATLNEGEISNNSADVAGVIVREGSELNVGKSFAIDDNEIYREEAAKATESTKGETRDAAPQETTAAPKRSLKSAKSPATQMRSGSGTEVSSFSALKSALKAGNTPIILDSNLQKDGKYYFAIDEPITISSTVEIKTKDGKEIIIARSNKFVDNVTAQKPAIFNVTSNGDLTLSEKVTMSGVELELPKVVKMKLTSDGVYFGTSGSNFAPVSNGVELSVDTNGYLLYDNGGTTTRVRWDFVINTVSGGNATDFRVTGFDEDGNLNSSPATSLVAGEEYVAWTPTDYHGTQYIAYNSSTNSLYRTSDINQAIRFTAEAVSGTGANALKVVEKVWTEEEVLPGGYFIHSTGSKVKIGAQVTLKDLKTTGDVVKAAPVYIGNGQFEMTGGSITGNTVGYDPDENWSDKSVVQYNQDGKAGVRGYIKGEEMTNTAGGVIFSGTGTIGRLTGGSISNNQGDAGGILVMKGADVTMSGNASISNNIGFHHAGAAQVEGGGTLTMNGGLMDRNVAWHRGGAVWVTEFGTTGYVTNKNNPNRNPDGRGNFIMNSGTISNNFAFVRGGGINVESDGVFLNGGTISGNMCKSLGGGIYVEGDTSKYSYTLVINKGNIAGNTAVGNVPDGDTGDTDKRFLDKKLENNVLKAGTPYQKGHHNDDDFPGVHSGNGGGIWLCPLGGTSVFTANNKNGKNEYVTVNDNTAAKSGQDLYVTRGRGAALIQNLIGSWEFDNGEGVGDLTTGKVINGAAGMENKGSEDANTGIQIINNRSRDGGGIAADGTIILGETTDVFRYESELLLEKSWDPGIETEKVTLQLFYEYDGVTYPLTKTTASDDDTSKEELYQIDVDEHNVTGTPDENGDYSMNDEGSAIFRWGSWKAKALLPSFIYHDGDPTKVVKLYEIRKPGSNECYDLTKPSGIEELYEDVKRLSTKTPEEYEFDIVWNVIVEEVAHGSNANYSVKKINPGKATVTLASENGPNVQGHQVKINYSNATLVQGIKNTVKDVNITLKKTNLDGSKPLKDAEFALYKAQLWGDMFVDGTRDGAAATPVNKTALISDANGNITINSISPGTYFLFETKAPATCSLPESPWFLFVNKTGQVTVCRMLDENQGNVLVPGNSDPVHQAYNASGNTYENRVNSLNNWLKKKWWKRDWFNITAESNTSEGHDPLNITFGNQQGITMTGNNIKLVNEVNPIEINKIDATTNASLGNAKFALYKVTGTGYLRAESKGFIAADIESDPSTGKISLPITGPGLYWIFETEAPTGYVRAKAPWLIYVSPSKQVTVVKLNSDNYGKIVKWNSTQVIESTYDDGKDALASWLQTNNSRWKKEWFNVPDIEAEYTNYNNPITLTGNKGIVVEGNKISNRKASVVLTKTDDSGRTINNNATFALYKANATPDAVFNTDGTAKTGTNNNKDITVKDGNKATALIDGNITTSEGKILVTDLDTDQLYLLFEKTAPTGFQRSKTPWLIWVQKNGDYKVYKYIATKVRVVNNTQSVDAVADVGWTSFENNLNRRWYPTTEQIDTENVNYDQTGGFNYIELTGDDANKLKNEPIEIEFEKIKKNDPDTKLNAVFDLYYAKKEWVEKTDTEDGHWQYSVDKSRGTNGKAVANITGVDGEYSVRIPDATPQQGESYAYYLLIETDIPDGYADPVVPWGIAVDPDGKVKTVDGNSKVGIWKVTTANAESQKKILYGTDPEDRFLDCNKIEKVTSYQIENDTMSIELIKHKNMADDKLDGARIQLVKLSNSPTTAQGTVEPAKTALGALKASDLADGQRVFLSDSQDNSVLFKSESDGDGVQVKGSGVNAADYVTTSASTEAANFYLEEHVVNGETLYAFRTSTGKYVYAESGDNEADIWSYIRIRGNFYTGEYTKWEKEVRTSLFKIVTNSEGEITDIIPTWNGPQGKKTNKLRVKTDSGKYIAGEKISDSNERKVTLWKESGDIYMDPVSGSTGLYRADNLTEGYYQIVETAAPDGYELIPNDASHRMIIKVENGSFSIVSGSYGFLENYTYNRKLQLILANDETTQIEAQKKWGNGAATDIPSDVEYVEFTLYAKKGSQETAVETRKVRGTDAEATNWKTVFKDLPKYYYDDDGERRDIVYSVVESVVTGYIPVYNRQGNTIIVNNYKVGGGKVTITVDKEWLMNGNPEALADDKVVSIKIWSNYADANKPAVVAEDTLTKAKNWTATITGLPRYGLNSETREVQYWIEEVGVEGFKLVTPTVTVKDSKAVETTNGLNSATSNFEYKAYAKKNPYVDGERPQKIAKMEYFVTRPDGTTEQVFCINEAYATPEETSPGEGVKYTREEISSTQLADYAYKNYRPVLGQLNDPNNPGALFYKILKAVYQGSGSDAANILADVDNNEHLLAHMTQYAIYEYTDLYSQRQVNEGHNYYVNGYKDFWNYKVKSRHDEDWVKDSTNHRYYKEGPYGLIYQETSNATKNERVKVGLEDEYQRLMAAIEQMTDAQIQSKNIKFYIYKPVVETNSDGEKYQYLIGVDSGQVNKYAHLKNEIEDYEINIYKHSSKETANNSIPLDGVEFKLAEPVAEGTEGSYSLTYGGETVTVKERDDVYRTNGNGNVAVDNLKLGKTYYLIEKNTKDGYSLPGKPIAFKLGSNGQETYEWTKDETKVITLKAGGSVTLKIANDQIYELPHSGGMGTYWFMVVGAMMMAFAATMVFARRRGMLA